MKDYNDAGWMVVSVDGAPDCTKESTTRQQVSGTKIWNTGTLPASCSHFAEMDNS
jgi:hypothetical protein